MPKANREQLFWYNFNPRKWYFKINILAGPDLVLLSKMGPDALKNAQMMAETDLAQKPHWEQMIERLKNPEEKLTLKESLISKFVVFFANLYLKSIDKQSKVLSNVPPLPKKVFQKSLDELTKAYNAQFPNDPVDEVGKAIKAGSNGQVFEGKTKSGKKLVFKAVKPEITTAYLDEYRRFLYYRELVSMGTTEQAKSKAVANVSETVHLLKMETQSKQEALNTKALKDTAEALNLKGFTVPDVLAATERGLVLPFVGDKDFLELNNLESGKKYRGQIAPDLLRLLTLSNAKPLDIHSGNIRVGGNQAYLIDHGRQAALKDNVHQALLGLTTAVYATPLTKNLASHPAIRQQLNALYQLNPTANNEYTQALNKLKALDEAPDEATQNKRMQDLSPELEKVDDLLAQLFNKRVGNFNFNAQDKNALNQEWKTSKSPSGYLNSMQISLLSPWTNYASQSKVLGLPDLSEQGLSLKDLDTYQQKASQFLKPYFKSDLDPKEADQLSADLKAEKLDNLLPAADLVDAPSDLTAPPQGAVLSKRQRITNRIEEDLKTGQGLKAKYEKELLLKAYDSHRKVADVAQKLSADLKASTRQSLSAAQTKVLNENISASIRNDFNLEPMKWVLT
ncbi:AarF/UbiB family protein [Vampirovibrio sp.]|uniref:AarF/UbiB family protein n=1 Tax=Vampirovibrio sp. TaxID=2717857 RepID=UPI003594404C